MLARALFLIVCLSSVASADPVAEKLFQDGRAAMAGGHIDEACELFRRSDTIEPRVGTIANIAECEERRGNVATAWSAFIDTRARAKPGDPKATYAAKHIAELEPRLPYLTIVVPAALRTLHATVHRNGVVLAQAEFDRKLPLDPGPYRIDVEAAGYASWHQDVTLVEGKETRVELPPLVAISEPLPNDARPKAPDLVPPVAVTVNAAAPVVDYHIGIGLLTGLSSDLDFIYGGRLVLNFAPLGRGVLRFVPSLMHSTGADPLDQYRTYELSALGTTLEYAYSINPRLVAAGGLGVGLDFFSDAYGMSTTTAWGCVRLSPTVRFDRFDIGAHVEFVLVSGRIVTLAELGVDVFVW